MLSWSTLEHVQSTLLVNSVVLDIPSCLGYSPASKGVLTKLGLTQILELRAQFDEYLKQHLPTTQVELAQSLLNTFYTLGKEEEAQRLDLAGGCHASSQSADGPRITTNPPSL